MGDLVESSANAYSTIVTTSHNIEWWAVIMAGMIILACAKALKPGTFKNIGPRLQQAIAVFVYFVVAFCVMLIMIQFEPYWMPFVEEVFDL